MSLPPVERPAAPLYDLDPEVVAAAVVACPAVAAMSGGPFGAAATYLPGRAVLGVRSGGERLEVHVVLAHPSSVHEAATQIRRALLGIAAERPVDVVVQDVALPGDASPRADAVGADVGRSGVVGEAGSGAIAVGVGWPPATASAGSGQATSPPVTSPPVTSPPVTSPAVTPTLATPAPVTPSTGTSVPLASDPLPPVVPASPATPGDAARRRTPPEG